MTFAKLQQPGELKDSLLGVGWDKNKDVLSVKFPTEEVRPTKRGVLSKLAKVYDPLGLVSPVILEGKVIYYVCDEKQVWDAKLTRPLLRDCKMGAVPAFGSVSAKVIYKLPRALARF